jgi:DNA-binding MarR family transcriptional regulator
MPESARASLGDVVTRLHSVAIHLIRTAWAEDEAMGLPRARSSALSVVAFRGPMKLGDLAAAEHVKAPTMTRIVAGLERGGFVERSVDPEDRRVVWIRATAKGRRTIEAGRDRRVRRLVELLGAFTPAEVAELERSVSRLEAALRG